MKGKKLLVLSAIAILLVGCKPGNSSSQNPTTSAGTSSETISSNAPSTNSSSSSEAQQPSVSLPNIDSTGPSSVVQGQVGNLTSAMIETIANPSITVNGKLTDWYVDGDTNTTETTEYFSEVKMAQDAWSGAYWIQPAEGEKANVTTDAYKKGAVLNDGTVEGAALERVYINKNNVPTSEPETLYDGTPVFWANNHLWNHLGQLNVNKFSVDSTNSYYEYSIDPESSTDYSADQYLMTYIGVSLSPLFSGSDGVVDTLNVYCDDNTITKIEMYTTPVVISTDENGNPVDQSWVQLEFTFEDIGTTTAGTPTPYEAGIHNDKLAAALTKMKGIKNYTFSATDRTTGAPSVDGGDYSIESVDSSPSVKAKNRGVRKVANYTNNTGTVGRVGYVTEDAILYEDTGKYSYAMDDKLYYIEYSGLKQKANNKFDEFEYDSNVGALVGKREFNGNIFDKQPSFDFAPEVFEFDGGSMDKHGNFLYKFSLRDATIAYQIAPEVSSHENADDASSSVASKFTIMVDDKGNFVSTSYPYDLVSGTYLGIINTTYSNIGTTTLPADTFDGYVERQVATSWDQFADMDYYETGSTSSRVTKSVTEVINSMYGVDASKFITPKDITDVFGDVISGPWHDKNQKYDANRVAIEGEYYDEFSFNIQSRNLDKNDRITDWEQLMANMNTVLSAKGYTRSPANCMNTLNTKYETFVNGNIMIVFDNIGYKTIYVSCYVTGNWTLNR